MRLILVILLLVIPVISARILILPEELAPRNNFHPKRDTVLERNKQLYYGKRNSNPQNNMKSLLSSGVPVETITNTLFKLLDEFVDENGDGYVSTKELNALQK